MQNKTKHLSIGFFCSSSEDLADIFHLEMRRLVKALAPLRPEVVYGGGRMGLMGTLANAALESGLRVCGVLPTLFDRPEIHHDGLDENILVADLFERKRTMLQRSDAFVIFPGGIGTLDEALEVLCLAQIGELRKPIYFYNPLDFWTTFFNFLDELREQRMISQDMSSLYKVFASPEELMNHIKSR